MKPTTEDTPAAVPATAKQVGEVHVRWAWTEPSVWTDRMLTALEQGVKGGIWFSLIDHHRWPNAYFAERGLFNLTTAHASVCQSSRR